MARCLIVVLLLLASCVRAYERNVAVNSLGSDTCTDEATDPFRGISPESFDLAMEKVPTPVPANESISPDPHMAIEWYKRQVRAAAEKMAPSMSETVRMKLWVHNQGAIAFSIEYHDAYFQELRVRRRICVLSVLVLVCFGGLRCAPHHHTHVNCVPC